MSNEQASAYAERGYDVGQRDAGIVLDTPNPDPTGDDYFHGDNPHTVGFGSRGAAVEKAGLDLDVKPGQSTADALGREDGAGWTAGEQQQSGGNGEPDESWRNQDIDAWAEQNGVELPSGLNKAEKLAEIRGQRG